MNFIEAEVYNRLPGLLKNLTDQFEGRERDIVLISCLGVLSGCIPNVFGKYDSNTYFPNLFTMIIGPPASGKGRMTLSQHLVNRVHNSILSTSKIEIDECKQLNRSKDYNRPKLDVKLAPGNVSSARLYSHLNISDHGVIILETEADTLSKMFKQEWGDFSDVLRKSFQHERISLSRDGEDKYLEVNCPKLSLVLSGTKDQIKPLVESKDNGLFSRFLFFYYDGGIEWKDISKRESFKP